MNSSMKKTTRVKKAKTRDSNSNMSGSIQDIYRLPVELLDLVLHNVWEDKRTIVACSQVSRLWHDVAHPHLFAFLKIASTYDFVDFYLFLLANPDIARHVRKLQLKRASTPWTDGPHPRDNFPVVGCAQLRDLVVLLPRLQELHLYNLWVMSSPSPAPDAPDPEPTRKLEKMTIERCRAPGDGPPSVIAVLNLASLFTSIDTLELLSMHVPYLHFDSSRLIRTVNVGNLMIINVSIPPYFETSVLYNPLREFLAPGCLLSLQSRCLHAFDPDFRSVSHGVVRGTEGLRSFGRLVESAARDSKHIHFPFRVDSSVGPGENDPGVQSIPYRPFARHVLINARTEHWRVLNLHACTSLTSFTLEICVPPARGPAGARDIPRIPLAEVCIAVLANIPATLRVLTVKLSGVREQAQVKSAKTLGLRALDAALAERHTHLERVEVMLDGGLSPSMLECSLALFKAMPKLRAKGVLAVVDWVD